MICRLDLGLAILLDIKTPNTGLKDKIQTLQQPCKPRRGEKIIALSTNTQHNPERVI